MQLIDTARRALQALILPREEIWEISRMGPGWLNIQGEILPQTFGLKSVALEKSRIKDTVGEVSISCIHDQMAHPTPASLGSLSQHSTL
jgi:hypothetical protein